MSPASLPLPLCQGCLSSPSLQRGKSRESGEIHMKYQHRLWQQQRDGRGKWEMGEGGERMMTDNNILNNHKALTNGILWTLLNCEIWINWSTHKKQLPKWVKDYSICPYFLRIASYGNHFTTLIIYTAAIGPSIFLLCFTWFCIMTHTFIEDALHLLVGFKAINITFYLIPYIL